FTLEAGSDICNWSAAGLFTITSAGSLVDNGGATVTNPAVNDGTITADSGELQFGSLTNDGTLNLEESVVTATTYTSDSSSDVKATIGGTTAGSNQGELEISGNATFAGDLTVASAPSYTPSGTYLLATYGSETGSLTLVGSGYSDLTISGGEVTVDG
ncbi:MAG: hypothetical protein ACLPYW_03135, partial [Acidimicrobiales bacterium]